MAKTRWLTDEQQCVWRTYLLMSKRLNAALVRQMQADSELSIADFEVLVALTDTPEGRVRYAELARILTWEKSRLSHQVARMQKRGLVERRACTEDGRGAYVAITERGRKAIEQAAPKHVETVQQLVFDKLSDDEAKQLQAISARILEGLDCPD
ncbi:MarR family winged helix-turn-helix transcriptional regulator [Thermocrispum municipale]|jgi:DNA-binding MarR family transcriptional regulator|uniref:MarR family winged helix-turn-helix transcriptional regulator n=1 Tax=Thermocrispum municipale TaxID=37926 RepID=UPI000409F7B9|nr:MarR family transcriptional regulator [Thermocrispum municipale]